MTPRQLAVLIDHKSPRRVQVLMPAELGSWVPCETRPNPRLGPAEPKPYVFEPTPLGRELIADMLALSDAVGGFLDEFAPPVEWWSAYSDGYAKGVRYAQGKRPGAMPLLEIGAACLRDRQAYETKNVDRAKTPKQARLDGWLDGVKFWRSCPHTNDGPKVH